MSHLYPRERVERVLRPLSSLTLHRILLKSFASDPLAVRASPSRFCDGKSFAVLYAAEEFSTAFVEVVVRDRFVHEEDRFIGFDEVEVRASIEFRLKVPPLNLVDLSGSGALDLGAPTDAAHAETTPPAARSPERCMTSTPASTESRTPRASPAEPASPSLIGPSRNWKSARRPISISICCCLTYWTIITSSSLGSAARVAGCHRNP